MAAVASAGNGNWSSTTPNAPWPGGTVPASTDTITIGHAVVIDQNVTAGSDPGFGGTAAIAISAAGVLSFDTTASRTVTLLGDVTMASGAQLLIGTSAARVPVANTITINFNNSGTIGRYGLRVTYSTSSVFKCYGATRKTNTTLSAQANSGQAVIVVNDATGWQAGDTIAIGGTTGTVGLTGQTEEKIINAGGVSGNTITLSTNLSNTHLSGAIVSNLTKNIVLTAAATKGWFADTRFGTAANHVLDNVHIAYTVNPATGINVVYGYAVNGTTAAQASTITATDMVLYKNLNGYNAGFIVSGLFIGTCSITNSAFFGTGGTSTVGLYCETGYGLTLTNSNFYKLNTALRLQANSPTLTNCNWVNCTTAILNPAGANITAFGLTINACAESVSSYGVSVNHVLTSCNFGTVVPNTTDLSFGGGTVQNVYNIFQYSLCNFQPITIIALQSYMVAGSYIQLANCTVGATSNVIRNYVKFGNFDKDLTTQKNSVSSIRLDTTATGVSTYTFTFLAKNGTAYNLRGNMRYNAAYDDAAYTLPSVTISGLGITPVVATATTAALSAWEAFSINVTQNSGADGLLTVTLSGNSATAAGSAYFDGIVSPPFITAARFYGYEFEETLPYRTVDPHVVASEATALAYTGIAIDWATEKVTVTTAHTLQEVYDYCIAQSAAAANLTKEVPINTSDSVNFVMATDWDIVITNVAVTATGLKLTLSGTGSYTITGAAGDFTGILADATTTRVKINTTGIVAGSRIQLYDTTAASELVNAIVSGTSHSLAFIHTTDHTIRLRLMYVSGSATAYYWHTQNGTVDNNGLDFVAVQEANTVYTNNSIDGSTVTECSVSGATIRIYIDDPDNTTAAQRIYNWYQWYLFSSDGIKEQDGTYVGATDSTHYVFDNSMKIINQDTVNPLNITGANIVPTSGAATNIFDVTNLASIALNFNRVEGFSYGLAAADIRTAVGLASANLDTQLTTIDDFLDTEVTAIKAKTDNLPTDPADESLLEAAITAATSPLATAAALTIVDDFLDTEITAIKAKTDNLPATPASTSDVPSAATIATAVWASVIETGFTALQSTRLILAALAGKLSGAATTTVVIRDVNDSKDRITATVDADGNRTGVTKDVS